MLENPDVIVIGSALNGLAAAVALGGRRSRRPITVMVVDRNDPRGFSNSGFDGRASAITESARRMLDCLGVWEKIAGQAQPMNEIIVTDQIPGRDSRPILLQFGEQDMGGHPSAHMVENRFLYQSLLEEASQSSNISFCTGAAVHQFTFGPGLARLSLEDGITLRSTLIVAADGRNSSARSAAGIDLVGWSYDQMGIVVTVDHDLPHEGRAEEHFTPSGPFAILPLPGNRSSLVWTERTADAKLLLALPDPDFADELQRRFGRHLGKVRPTGPRHAYPLAMFIARQLIGPRLALVGDAAHIVHPIAGLGFNLGLRDVAALAECVHDAVGLGVDPGSSSVLDRYSAWRRFDTVATAMAMDGLNRLFSNDNPVLRILRDSGLLTVNKIVPLKSMFVREAAGQTGALPRLLQGLMP